MQGFFLPGRRGRLHLDAVLTDKGWARPRLTMAGYHLVLLERPPNTRRGGIFRDIMPEDTTDPFTGQRDLVMERALALEPIPEQESARLDREARDRIEEEKRKFPGDLDWRKDPDKGPGAF